LKLVLYMRSISIHICSLFVVNSLFLDCGSQRFTGSAGENVCYNVEIALHVARQGKEYLWHPTDEPLMGARQFLPLAISYIKMVEVLLALQAYAYVDNRLFVLD